MAEVGRPKVIFDTSAINKLANDAEFLALSAGIRAAFFLRLTETNIAEVVATQDQSERLRLWQMLRYLTKKGECILPFNQIVENAIRIYNRRPGSFDWRRMEIRLPQAEAVIWQQDHISDELAQKQRDQLKMLQKQFEEVYSSMRPSFDAIFEEAKSSRPSLSELLKIFLKDGGAAWAYGELLYSKVVPSPTEETVRAFYKAFPPFSALVVALCVVQYDRCIRDLRTGPSLRAGRLDMFMATYLPYCDQFVSDDDRQLRCLQAVSAELGSSVTVRSYAEFRMGLMGF